MRKAQALAQCARPPVSGSVDRATSSVRRVKAILPLAFTGSKIPRFARAWRSPHLGENGYIELRIILPHIAGAILTAKLLDDRRHLFGISDRNGFEPSL